MNYLKGYDLCDLSGALGIFQYVKAKPKCVRNKYYQTILFAIDQNTYSSSFLGNQLVFLQTLNLNLQMLNIMYNGSVAFLTKLKYLFQGCNLNFQKRGCMLISFFKPYGLCARYISHTHNTTGGATAQTLSES